MSENGLVLNLVSGDKKPLNKKKKNAHEKARKKYQLNLKKKSCHKFQNPAFKKNNFTKKKLDKKVSLESEITLIHSEFESGLSDNLSQKNVEEKKLEEKPFLKKKFTSTDKTELKNQRLTDSKTNSKSNLNINLVRNDSKETQNLLIKDINLKNCDKKVSTLKINQPDKISDKKTDDSIDDNLKEIKKLAYKQALTAYSTEFSDGLNSIESSNKLDNKINTINKKRKIENFENNDNKNNFSKKIFSKDKQKNINSDNLKEDFKKMFSKKGSVSKINYSTTENSNFDNSIKSKPYISSLFREDLDLPKIHLNFLKNERKESVFSEEANEIVKNSLHPHLIGCLESKFNIKKLTNVQILSIPSILNKKDCFIKSVTGSGKTLAYLLPIVQMLQEKTPKISRSDGLFSLIIVPTRELVLQCYESLLILCKSFTWIVPGYLMGGENKHSEKNRIRKGINILVCTPGRLLDHIETTKNLNLSNLEHFIVDEADRLYESGFEESIKKIVSTIHEQRNENQRLQNILLSATLSRGVQSLAGLIVKDVHLIDTNDENNEINTNNTLKYTLPSNLHQNYIIAPAKLRLLTLSSFLIDQCSYQKNSKVLIFMSTQDVVDFHSLLFEKKLNEILEESDLEKIQFFKLHGNMSQQDRTMIFNSFKKTNSGVLLCTDVACRGIDLPEVNWVIQYSCPSNIEDYVHRVGRTARIENEGKSIIFLLSSEIKFLELLQKILKTNFDEIKAENVIKVTVVLNFAGEARKRCYREQASQLQYVFENTVVDNEEYHLAAKKAYVSYTRAYASYPKSVREYLPFKELHLGHLCKSFCLRDSPKSLGAFRFEMPTNKSKSLNYSQKSSFKRTNKVPSEIRNSEFDSGF